jgi:hypothetical protein
LFDVGDAKFYHDLSALDKMQVIQWYQVYKSIFNSEFIPKSPNILDYHLKMSDSINLSRTFFVIDNQACNKVVCKKFVKIERSLKTIYIWQTFNNLKPD